MAKESDLLDEAREAFHDSADTWSVVRQDFLDDVKFARLGDQWPENIRRERDLDGRPCLTLNKLPTFIRQVVNDARMNRPQIKVLPADSSASQDVAEIMGGIVRNIENVSHAHVAYDTAVDFAVSGGFGFWRIDLEYANEYSFDLEPRINRINNPLTVYWDPLTQAADSSDWRYCFVAEKIAKKKFEEMFPKADASSWTDDDKDYPWVDDATETVRLAEWWTRDETERMILRLASGTVVYADEYDKPETRAVFDAAGDTVVAERMVPAYKITSRLMSGKQILEESEWPGQYIPIIPVYGDEINVEGKRHFRSLIRDAKDTQRLVNYWRSMSTELVALAPKAPWVGKKGAFTTDAEKWSTANTRNHAYIEYDGAERPVREAFDGVPAGAVNEALNANDDMKAILGIFEPNLGMKSNERSGIAIANRQRQGNLSTFHFIDNLSRGIEHTGRVLVDLIPKLYTGPRIMRILGGDDTPSMVPVNQPVTVQGVEKIYDICAGKYDVVVKAGPSFATRREEAAEQLIALIQAFPPAAGVVGPELVRNLDLPNGDKIAAMLEAMIPPHIRDPNQPAPPSPEMVKAQQEMQKAKAEFDLKRQQAEADFALERDKMAAKLQMERESNLIEAQQKTELELQRMQREHQLKLEEMDRETALRLRELQMEFDLSLVKFRAQAATQAMTAGDVNLKRPE